MKRFKVIVFFVLAAALFFAGIAMAADPGVSVDKGKTLFNDPKLGTTGKSCNDCHQNGKDMAKAAGSKNLEVS